jgi:hypothetical protein
MYGYDLLRIPDNLAAHYKILNDAHMLRISVIIMISNVILPEFDIVRETPNLVLGFA